MIDKKSRSDSFYQHIWLKISPGRRTCSGACLCMLDLDGIELQRYVWLNVNTTKHPTCGVSDAFYMN